MKPYLISRDELWEEIDTDFGRNGGVYILKSYVNEKRNNIKPISRFLGIDKEGILYIGQTIHFFDRVIALAKTIAPDYKTASHECGDRYNANQKIKLEFPYNILFVELIESVEPKKTETKLLSKYVKEFGEVPPLNRNG
jgi:hypothetical protein